MPIDKPYTVEQVAEILSTNKRAVYREIRRGNLRAVKLGREYRVPADSLQAFLNPTAQSKVETQGA